MLPLEFRRDWLVTHAGWQMSIPKSKIGTAIADLKNLLDVDGWLESGVKKYRAWRQDNSLEDPQFLLHREPDCNLLIPYFAVYEDWLAQGSPSDWPTEKSRVLRELASVSASIFAFESFWSAIPQGKGGKHIAKSLRKNELCRGMLAQLLAATAFVQAGTSRVVPCFMNSLPNEDKSDILMTWNDKDIEVHCKSKIPGAGYLVPFDVFDYWAGCFLRDTQFFSRSWYIRFELSCDIGIRKARELRDRFQHWLKSGLVFENTEIEEGMSASVEEIQIPPNGLNKNAVRRLGSRPRFRAFSAWNGARDGNYHALSVFDVAITRRPHPARSLSARLREAKEQATGKRPAIAFIHIFDDWNLDDLLLPQAAGFRRWLLGSLGDKKGRNISAVILTCEPKHTPMSGMVGVKQYPNLLILNPQALHTLPAGFNTATS